MEFVLPAIQFLKFVGLGMIVLGVLVLGGLLRGSRGPLNYLLGSIICIAIGIVILTLRSTGSITLAGDELVLKAALCKTQVVNTADVENIWLVSDLADSPWRPGRKKSGTAIGDIRTGWFTLQNGRNAYVVLQGWRGICFEAGKDHVFVIGTENFDDLLAAFKKTFPQLSAASLLP
jgi:hypothetical protein